MKSCTCTYKSLRKVIPVSDSDSDDEFEDSRSGLSTDSDMDNDALLSNFSQNFVI